MDKRKVSLKWTAIVSKKKKTGIYAESFKYGIKKGNVKNMIFFSTT